MVQSHRKLQLRSTPSLKFLLVMFRSYVYSNRVINSNSRDVDDLMTKNDQWQFWIDRGGYFIIKYQCLIDIKIVCAEYVQIIWVYISSREVQPYPPSSFEGGKIFLKDTL